MKTMPDYRVYVPFVGSEYYDDSLDGLIGQLLALPDYIHGSDQNQQAQREASRCYWELLAAQFSCSLAGFDTGTAESYLTSLAKSGLILLYKVEHGV